MRTPATAAGRGRHASHTAHLEPPGREPSDDPVHHAPASIRRASGDTRRAALPCVRCSRRRMREQRRSPAPHQDDHRQGDCRIGQRRAGHSGRSRPRSGHPDRVVEAALRPARRSAGDRSSDRAGAPRAARSRSSTSESISNATCRCTGPGVSPRAGNQSRRSARATEPRHGAEAGHPLPRQCSAVLRSRAVDFPAPGAAWSPRTTCRSTPEPDHARVPAHGRKTCARSPILHPRVVQPGSGANGLPRTPG
jgi:hypothetical protein